MNAAPVLLSGFEPFGGAASNPSMDLALALDGARLADGTALRGIVLPVTFGSAAARLADAIAALRPRLVLALGFAPRRRLISVERVALNLCDAPIPDNAGIQPPEGPVLAGAPPALFATLPVRRMAQALLAAGLPAELSLSAGSYVCNELMFRLLHGLDGALPAGFMHVPAFEQVGFDEQRRAVLIALEAALQPAPAVAEAATLGRVA